MSESSEPSRAVSRPPQSEPPQRPPAARSAQRIAIAALAGTPLALLTGVFVSHDVIPKVILLTSGAAFLLFLFPKWSPLMGDLWNQPRGRHFLGLVVVQCFSLSLSTLYSRQIPLSLAGTVWRRYGLIEQSATLVIATALACTAGARRGGRMWVDHSLFRAVGVFGGLASIYGTLQYLGIDPFLDRKLYALKVFGGIARPPSTMGQAIYFSSYLAPVLFMAVSSGLGDPVRLWRRVQALAALLCASAIVLSASRGAIAGALAGAMLFGWRASGGRKRAVPRQYAAILAAILVAAPIFVLSPAGENLRNRMSQWREDFGGSRFRMWRECAFLIAQHPILGEGPDRFAGEFRKIQSVDLSRRYPDFYYETPHNTFIDAACAQGIPGMLILVAVFLLPWSGDRDGLPAEKPVAFDPVKPGLEAAMLAILISSIFTSFTLVESLYLWSIAGLSVAFYPGALKEGPRRELRAARIPAIACGAILLAAGAVLAAQDSAWASFGRAVDARDFAATRKNWSKAVSSGLGLPGYELWGSRRLAELGLALGDSRESALAWKLAAESAALAEKRSEDPASSAYESAVLAAAAGDLPRAEWKARETIRLAPNWYRGHLLLSQFLRMRNEYRESTREAVLSSSLGARKQP